MTVSNPQPWTVNQLGVWGLATFTALCLISEAISADQSRAAADISSALQERFNMTPKEVESALASQSEAIAVHQILKEELGEAYAGAWFDDDAGMLAVAFTKAELRSAVSAAGALLVLVSHSLEDFQAASKRLIEIFHGSQFNSSIAGWHVDAEANQLVLEVLDLQDAARSQIQAYLAANGIEASLLRLDESITRAAFLNDIRGGDPADNAPRQRTCSVGFSVDGGFTFAGHCGWGNDNVTGHNSQTMGTLAASSFPPVVYSEPGVPDFVESNRDVAWVSANSSWTPVGEINP